MADGDLKLSDSPNVDTGLVEKDGSLHRAILTAEPEGTLQLSDSANVSTGYVTDGEGKKHKVNLVAEVEGDLELPENPNADTGYVTDGDGKKHKVKLTASLHGGGSAPVIDELNVTPSTSAQEITAPEGTDGYSPVKVAAVTSSIDANIVAGNIKKDVQILGVTGSYKGVAPSGTKPITSNGIHDVAGYANADVQVPTNVPELYRVFRNNNGKLENSISTAFIPLPSSITDVGDYCLYNCYRGTQSSALSGAVDLSNLTTLSGSNACAHMFRDCTRITSVDLSSLTSVTNNNACENMFCGCTGLTSVDLSNLTTVNGTGALLGMFDSCTTLTTINLSSLTTIGGNRAMGSMFARCTSLTSVNLSSLVAIDNFYGAENLFTGCTNLTNFSFTSLASIKGSNACASIFSGCTSLTSVSFPALTSSSFGTQTNQFNNMLQGVTGCTVHFPSNLDPAGGSTVISSLTGYPNFGGTNTVLAFDLPATE